MKIKTANKIIVTCFPIVIVMTLISAIFTVHYLNIQMDIIDVQRNSLRQTERLVHCSERLTNAVRAFSATGESRYDDEYNNEVNVEHNCAKAVDALRMLGTPKNELSLIEEAKRNSDELILLENKAFAAGYIGDFELARHMVYGREYQNSVNSIMHPIQQFQQQMEQRFFDEIREASERKNTAFITFGIISSFLFATILMQFFFYGRKIISPIIRLNDVVEGLGVEKNSALLDDFNDDSEIAALAKSIKTYHETTVKSIQHQQERQQISEIITELHKVSDFRELARVFMSRISKILGMRYGTFYVVDEEKQILKLIGGYCVSVEQIGKEFSFNDGLTGQCATEKKFIRLDNIPTDYVPNFSLTGAASPDCLMIQPLILNDKIVGLLEIATYSEQNDRNQEILVELEIVLATSIEVLMQTRQHK